MTVCHEEDVLLIDVRTNNVGNFRGCFDHHFGWGDLARGRA